MTLETLKGILEDTGSTAIMMVLFDFNQVLNENFEKDYPLTFWDIDNSTWVKNKRNYQQDVTIDVYQMERFDEYKDNKFAKWDQLESLLDSYLENLNENGSISILNMDNLAKELYAPGVLSVDMEIGIKYRVKLKMWC